MIVLIKTFIDKICQEVWDIVKFIILKIGMSNVLTSLVLIKQKKTQFVILSN